VQLFVWVLLLLVFFHIIYIWFEFPGRARLVNFHNCLNKGVVVGTKVDDLFPDSSQLCIGIGAD
jgi:hypothetical protein